jgi:arylsulfatase A-like enzyme
MRLPGAAEAGRRVAALTQAVDLPATLCDAFQVAAPAWHGHSLLPLARGGEAVRPYACSSLETGGALEGALRSPEWAFLLPLRAAEGDAPRQPRLHARPDDRWELNDVRQHHLELAEHMAAVLREFVAATRRPGPMVLPELREERDLLAALERAQTGETDRTQPSDG